MLYGGSMMGSGVLHDLFGVLLVPPCITFVWLLMSRGLTDTLGTCDSETVRGWTRSGFWLLLVLMYAVAVAIFIYKYFIRGA